MTLRRRLHRAMEILTWRILIWSARSWARHYMDQWDKVKTRMPSGADLHLTLSHSDGGYPDSFDRVDARGRVIVPGMEPARPMTGVWNNLTPQQQARILYGRDRKP